jgi:NADPH-dependent 2,4-dienoyl-CoA reductase/sulfur reductase-like enzyme
MTRLRQLYTQQRQSPWLDNLTRAYLRDGTLADFAAAGIRGVTANPTIFANAVEGSDAYDEQFAALIADGYGVEDAYWELAVGDVGEALTAALSSAQRVAIIGAGWIGLETAAAARAAGDHVTVIERSQLPLLNVLGPEVAATYAALHRHHGIDLRPGSSVHEIIGDTGKVTGVRLADGSVIAANAVIVGVGITPNTELAEAAGLRVDNGIFVDEHLATADPDVFAAGDVANSYYRCWTLICAYSTGRPPCTRVPSRRPT